MKKTLLVSLRKVSRPFLGLAIAFVGITGIKGQTTLYTTDFGTVANVNPVGWTFAGVGMNTSTNTASSGYTGASGGVYLGEGNSVTFTNTSGNSQASSPLGISEAVLLVSTTGYSNITLSFGMRKSGAGYNTSATYSLQWSTNGTTYTDITYTEATAGSWGLATGSGLSLPAGANNQSTLYFRWIFNRTGTGSNFKIDDVAVTGSSVVTTPATVSFLSNDTTVLESVGSANVYVKLTSTSTASSAITISVSALSNASAADYTVAALTLTFAANAPVNSTYPINFSINNDAIAESAEYLILKLDNPQNMNIGTINQFAFYISDNDKAIPAPSNALTLNLLSSFSNTVSGSNSAEIVAHDPTTQRLYIANSIGAKLDIVDFVNPSSPSLILSVPITTYGNINSVAVYNGTVAAAIENGTNPQDSGKVVFFNQNGVFLKQVKVGMMPDMITFNNAGTKVITANEGEPNAAYTNDPDGSVSIIDISGGVSNLTQTNVAHVTFTVYNGQETALRSQGIRIYGLGANAAKDFEPEYVAIAKDDSKAWVTLQENNAIVEINLATNTITSIRALGTKDHLLLDNGMDASNTTRSVNIANVPVKGFYLPDAIASYTVGGVNYLITANEGDSRAYAGFSEEVRISSANLDPAKFPLASQLKSNYYLGRLNITDKAGDIDNDGDLDTLYSYGSRSFSIWNANTGVQVYDSKDDLEMITATNTFSNLFNASNSNSTKKDRSDDKGPEPEGVTIGTIGGSIYAFIALERIGGVMVYDVTNPLAPVYVTYVNNRTGLGPDLGSEGIIFIPQSKSPNGQHLVIAANEVSSTLSIWGIAGCAAPLSSSVSVSGPSIACSSSAPILSVANSPTLTYQWSINGVAISGATLSSVSATTSGSYSVAINGGANCSTGSLSKSFTINATPTIAVAGSSAACIASALTLTASGASTYTWNNNYNGNTLTIFPASSSVYSIAGTSTNGCSASVTKTVGIYPNPTITISGGTNAVCQNQPLTLTASGAANYTWSTGANTATLTMSPTGGNMNILVNGTSVNGCAGFATVQLTVNPAPIINISGAASQLCSGSSVNLSATGANTYTWNAGGNSANLTASPLTTTAYVVSGTGSNSCVGSATQIVTVVPSPVLNVGSTSSIICVGQSATLNVTGAMNYTWSEGTLGSQVKVSPTLTTTYSVTGTNSANCSAMSVLTMSVSECTGLSALSKRGSDLTIYPNPANSEIHLNFEGASEISIRIYSSLGALVLSKENHHPGDSIQLTGLNKGVYFVEAAIDSSRILKKLIIE